MPSARIGEPVVAGFPPVAVVTDSTAALTAEEAAAAGVTVVPLHVLIDNEEFTEGVDVEPAQVIEAIRKNRRVSTSRPSPAVLLDRYERLAAGGAQAVVSAHLSGQLSGTCDGATLAAREAPVPVDVVDTASTGLALGYAVLAAARGAGGAGSAGSGGRGEDSEASDAGDASDAGERARRLGEEIRSRCARTTVLCYVHSLDQLRRGGRIGAAASLLGSALAIKPIIALTRGHVEPVARLRTSGRALARLTDLAVESVEALRAEAAVGVGVDGATSGAAGGEDAVGSGAGGHVAVVTPAEDAPHGNAPDPSSTASSSAEPVAGGVRIAVHHADALERAERLAADLRERCAVPAGEGGEPVPPPVQVRELPAVLAVHLGPGTIAVVVAPA